MPKVPKDKLTSSQKIERYKRKIEKIEKSEHQKRFRRMVFYSDDSDIELGDNTSEIPTTLGHEVVSNNENDQNQLNSKPELENPSTDNATDSPRSAPDAAATMAPDATAESAAPTALTLEPPLPIVEPPPAPAVDPALLAALGESTEDHPNFGPSIHDSLANLWHPLLKKGLAKEDKDKLLKEYLIPNNCQLLQAPKLNAEISAAVGDAVRGRDKKYLEAQQQLGHGITAVNRAMDVMLKTDNKVEAIRHLGDGCRILSDLHNFFTSDRTKIILPSLDKSIALAIQDVERDETLFSNALTEKLKAIKAIEKQGQQIKKSTNTKSSTARPSTSQGNWSGPPRYSSNRRGRGGGRKQNPAPAPPATRRPYTVSSTAARPPAQTKTRAQAHQQ